MSIVYTRFDVIRGIKFMCYKTRTYAIKIGDLCSLDNNIDNGGLAHISGFDKSDCDLCMYKRKLIYT